MNTVIKQIKRCFSIYAALFITLITSRTRGHQHCGQEHLVHCSKPLSLLTDSGLSFVTTKADLDRICPDLKGAIKCIHAYTRKCMNFHQRNHFKQLFHGTGAMVHELCNNSTYQEEYLKYSPCMEEISSETEVCFSRYTNAMKAIHNKQTPQPPISSEEEYSERRAYPNNAITYENYRKKKREAADEGIKNVCCTFQEYVQCYTHTTSRKCGDEAAKFSRHFLDRMSSSMIKMHCSNYGTTQCGLTSGVLGSFGSSMSYLQLTLTTLGATVLSSLLRYTYLC